MAYHYETEKGAIFTPEGAKMLLEIKTNAERLLATAGAFQGIYAWSKLSGNTWTMQACLDYLVEVGELRVWRNPGVWLQYHIYYRQEHNA